MYANSKKQPKVLIIIINYNNDKDTIECLKYLKNINYKNYKILIIDNGSKKPLKVLKYKNVMVKKNKKNLGFSKAANIGLKYSLENNYDYSLLLNNDTIVEKDFLKILIKTSQSKKDFGLVSPLILYYDKPTRIWSLGLNWKYGHTHNYYLNKDIKVIKQLKKSVLKFDYLSGCCLLIRNDVVKNVGFIDEAYFMYMEDMDYCDKAKKKGYTPVCNINSRIYHKVSKTAGKGEELSKFMAYHYAKNGVLFAKKNLKGLTKINYILNRIYYFIPYNTIKLIIKGKPQNIIPAFKGFIDGIKFKVV